LSPYTYIQLVKLLYEYAEQIYNDPFVGDLFSNDLVPLTKIACRASLTCLALEHNKTYVLFFQYFIGLITRTTKNVEKDGFMCK